MSTPFVGRADELAVLTSLLSQAREGRGGFVLLHGEAGIGKTRLADRVSMLAAEAGFSVHWGTCCRDEGAPAFWPWLAVLRSLAASASRDGGSTRIAWASRIVDEFLESPAAADEAAGAAPAPGDRFRLFHAVAVLIDALSTAGPLLLVLDDLHDADEGSLELLRFVAREAPRRRMLLLATGREPAMGRNSPGLFAAVSRQAVRLPLAGLAPGELDELLDAIGDGCLQPGVREAVKAASDGNPFFADELVRVLRSRPSRTGDSAIPVPFTVKEALRERLAPCEPPVRAMLETAAAIGREFGERLLSRTLETGRDTTAALLQSAFREGLVERSDGDSWRFVHMLVRETLREDLETCSAPSLHLRIAAALEIERRSGHRVHAAALAHHLLQARPAATDADVVDALTAAARESASLLAHEEAARHLGAALGVLEDDDHADPRTVARLLVELGCSLRAAGRLSRARENFLRAASLLRSALAAGAADDEAVDLFGRAVLGYGGVSETGRVDAELVALLEEALRIRGAGDSALASRLLARLAMALYFAPDPSRCVRISVDAVSMAVRCGDSKARVEALVARHFVLWTPGTAADRLGVADDLLSCCDSSRDAEVAAEARLGRIADLLELGDAARAEAETHRYEADAEASRLPVPRWHAALLRAAFAALRGNAARARRHGEEALAIGVEAELPNARAFHLAQMFQWAVDEGRLAELEAPLRAAADSPSSMAVWTACAAEACAAAGHEDLARSDYARLVADDFAAVPRDGMWTSTMAILARLAVCLRDAAGIHRLRELLLPHRDEWVVAVGAIATAGPVRFTLGLLAAAAGEVDEAESHFDAVADQARDLGYHGLLQRCDAELARLRCSESTETGAPAAAARAEFRRSADFWTLAVGDESLRLRDSKGLRYIHFLLAHPGRELHVFDLVAAVEGNGAAGQRGAGDAQAGDRARDSGPLADAAAMRAYRRRVRELDAELAEALANNDSGRLERLHEERDFLARELASVAGLGGRPRRAGSPSEQVRVRVTKVIGLAMRRIATASPAVGRTLSRGIRTGTFCSYRPDPDRLLDWSTGGD